MSGATCGTACAPGQIKQQSVNGRFDVAPATIGAADLATDAVPGYATDTGDDSLINFTSATTEPGETLATLSLPAGTWIINAKTVLNGNSQSAGYGYARCVLSIGSQSDVSDWLVQLFLVGQFGDYQAATTIPFQLEATTTTTSSATLACANLASPAGPPPYMEAADSAIDAIQTTSAH